VYLTLGGLVEKFLGDEKDKQKIVDFLGKSSDKIIQPFIDKKYDELCTMMQAYENKMVMEREVIADVGVWTAKKRYMLNVHDSEGIRYETPKMKIMGIETTRSSTPSIVRAELKKAIKIVLTGTEDQMHKFIEKFKSEFHEMEPEDIAFPRSVNGMDRYRDSAMIYRKGTPIAVKGSLVYNHHIKKNGLDGKYSTIMDGEKVKFLYLKQPNPVQDSVISFVSGIPKELDLHRFVNYKSQFEKSFLDPLQNILTVVGWTTEERSSLESLFV
jgi:DNA polymerase elongation subunit (family B)